MTMKRNIKQLLVMPLAMTFNICMLFSCLDDAAQQDVSDIKQDASDIKVNNGYLEFRDEQAFERTRNLLKTKDKEFLDTWERQFPGFVSQRSLYEKAIEEDFDYYNSTKSPLQGSHSEFVENNTDLFLFDEDGTFHLNLPITEEFISAFVTRKGLLKIGERLYQYSANSIKVIVDGDETKIDLLSQINESSEEYGVLVYNISVKEIEFEDSSMGRTEFSGNANCTGYTSGGGQRVIGKVYEACTAVVDVYGNYGYPGSIVSQTKVIASAENQIKNIFGWSKKSTNFLVIQGTVNITALGGSGPVNVYTTTSGNSASSISVWIWVSAWYPQQCFTMPLLFSGNLEFHGRDGSYCSI